MERCAGVDQPDAALGWICRSTQGNAERYVVAQWKAEMKLKLSLVSGTVVDDIVVTVDATATVNQLAERLRVSHPRVLSAATAGETLCIRVNPGTHAERTVAPYMVMVRQASVAVTRSR